MDLQLGDRVRIDIPDELDPDFRYHGEHAIVIDIDHMTCECRCGIMYRVALEDRDFAIDVHPWDVRPPQRQESGYHTAHEKTHADSQSDRT